MRALLARAPRARRAAALLALLGLAACGGDEPASSGPDARAPAPATAAPPPPAGLRFTDVTAGSGLALVNVSGDPEAKLAIPENLGQGAAALDFDGDGDLDLFVANGDAFEGSPAASAERRCALYENRGDLRFVDVTERAGLVFDAWCHGANACDFDADGDPDLYVTVYRGPNRFFENRGDGTFVDRSAEWGGADPGPSTASAFLDADGDGDLDLYVANYVRYDPDDPPNGGAPCEWKGLAVSCGPKGTPPAADTFWRNDGGRLVSAAEEHGFATVEPTWALGCVTGDVDGDGDTDLYVANDSAANYLFLNEGGGRFREAGVEHGVDRNEDGREQAGMGVDCGDVDNDLRLDLLVTNFSHDANALYRAFETPSGRRMFDDAAYAMRLGKSSYPWLSWGTAIVDLDHDGWQDLVVVSGHVYPQVDTAEVGTSYAQPNQVFRNLGPGERGIVFEEHVPGDGDAFAKRAVSRGLVQADLDDDGDRDLLVVEMDAPPTLIRNDSAKRGHWIGFALVGEGKNRDAIGARLVVTDSRGVARLRHRASGAGYLSSQDPRVHVGLGDAAGPVSVVVRWPSGRESAYPDLAVDRTWRLDAGAAEAAAVERP